jgi:hypothetical protein
MPVKVLIRKVTAMTASIQKLTVALLIVRLTLLFPSSSAAR